MPSLELHLMKNKTLFLAVLVLVCWQGAFCQTSNTVVGAGYAAPAPIAAAPGQLLTIFVQGVGLSFPGLFVPAACRCRPPWRGSLFP